MSTRTRRWQGTIAHHHVDWTEAAKTLSTEHGDVDRARDDHVGSPYREQFKQGANIVPRVLLTVKREAAGPLGIPGGSTRVRSARSNLEKGAWKTLDDLEGVVEDHYLRPLYTGASIVAFRPRETVLAVIPWLDGEILSGSSSKLDAFAGLAAWWRSAERLWEKHKSKGSKLDLVGQIEYQSKLSKQFPLAAQRVVYTTSGQYLAACRIEDATAVIDSSLYWFAARGPQEARYLTAILNSTALLDLVRPLQARGEHNPRHFHLLPLDVPIPAFDVSLDAHRVIAELAARAETVALLVGLDEAKRFEAARRDVRRALEENGIAAEIDEAVRSLLLP